MQPLDHLRPNASAANQHTTSASTLPRHVAADVGPTPIAASAATAVALSSTPASLVVFWPDRLEHLFRPDVDTGSQKQMHHGSAHSDLLLGRIVLGAPHELAVVVSGVLAVQHFDRSRLSSSDLVVVGVCRAATSDEQYPRVAAAAAAIESSLLADSSVWLDARLVAHSSLGLAHTWIPWHRPSPCHIGIRSICLAYHDRPPRPPSSITVVYYRTPDADKLQYFALEPLRLGPVSGARLARLGSLLLHDATVIAFLRARDAHYEASPLQRRLVQLLMLDPARWTELVRDDPASGLFPEGTAFRRAIGCINGARRSRRRGHHRGEGNAISPPATPPSPKDSAPRCLLRGIGMSLLAAARCLRRLLNAEVAASSGGGGGGGGRQLSLVTASASARQLDTRLSQLLIAPSLATRLRRLRKRDVLPTEDLAAPYIGLWNSVWLVANDVILGHAAAALLIGHRRAIAEALRIGLRRAFVDDVLRLLDWLGDWPAGLKLNTELSLFFQEAYSSFACTWRDQVLDVASPHLETMIVAAAVCGRMLGVTMSLCLLCDALQLLTLHITVFHACARRTFGFFVVVLSALFDLFRGKKRNALRGGRLDKATYELDQLLLGTILFTLSAFLVPTCYVFYLAFAMLRLAVVMFEAVVLETLLGMLNHLPLFALMLRFKDPSRLPASIRLDAIRRSSDSHDDDGDGRRYIPANHMVLRSNALGFVEIFEGYSDHVAGILDLPMMLARALMGRSLRCRRRLRRQES